MISDKCDHEDSGLSYGVKCLRCGMTTKDIKIETLEAKVEALKKTIEEREEQNQVLMGQLTGIDYKEQGANENE